MMIGLIIYDRAGARVLVNERNDLSLFENKVIAASTYKIAESDMARIFSIGEVTYYLVAAELLQLPEEANYLSIYDLTKQTTGIASAWQSLANYLYRMGDLVQEQMVLALKSKDIDLTVAVMAKIIENNPGISLARNNRDKIIVLDAENTDQSDMVIDFEKLSYNSLDELYWQIMAVIAWQFSQKIANNAQLNQAHFYGLAGMTASGKGQLANLAEKEAGVWSLKLAFFVETANLLIDTEATQLRDYYAIQLLMDYVNQYEGQRTFFLDDIYSENIHNLLKEVLGQRYDLLFLDANEELRQARTHDSTAIFAARDAAKTQAGVPKLKVQAQTIFDANQAMVDVQASFLDYLVQNNL